MQEMRNEFGLEDGVLPRMDGMARMGGNLENGNCGASMAGARWESFERD